MLVPKTANADPSAEQARINAWLAELQLKSGETQAAQQSYRNLENYERSARGKASYGLAFTLGVPPIPELKTLILTQGSIFEKQGKWGEAAAAYARAMDENVGGNQALYQYARALMKTGDPGDHKRALGALQKLSTSPTDDFWRKLAQQALANNGTMAKEGNQ